MWFSLSNNGYRQRQAKRFVHDPSSVFLRIYPRCLLSLALSMVVAFFLSKRNKKGLVGEICKTGETSRVLFHVFVSIYRLCNSQRV